MITVTLYEKHNKRWLKTAETYGMPFEEAMAYVGSCMNDEHIKIVITHKPKEK